MSKINGKYVVGKNEEMSGCTFYVYLIQPAGRGDMPVKIGYSKDPDARLKNLQTAHPTKLKICTRLGFESEELAREAERTLQWLAGKRFRRMEGEWFIIYGSWASFIAQTMKIFDSNQAKKNAL